MIKTSLEFLSEMQKDGRKIAYINYDNSSTIASYEKDRQDRFIKWSKSRITKVEKELCNHGKIYRGQNKRGFILAMRDESTETIHNWNEMRLLNV